MKTDERQTTFDTHTTTAAAMHLQGVSQPLFPFPVPSEKIIRSEIAPKLWHIV